MRCSTGGGSAIPTRWTTCPSPALPLAWTLTCDQASDETSTSRLSAKAAHCETSITQGPVRITRRLADGERRWTRLIVPAATPERRVSCSPSTVVSPTLACKTWAQWQQRQTAVARSPSGASQPANRESPSKLRMTPPRSSTAATSSATNAFRSRLRFSAPASPPSRDSFAVSRVKPEISVIMRAPTCCSREGAAEFDVVRAHSTSAPGKNRSKSPSEGPGIERTASTRTSSISNLVSRFRSSHYLAAPCHAGLSPARTQTLRCRRD